MAPTELVWAADEVPALHRPVLIVALAGLFDVARAATTALDHLKDDRSVATVASIDPDGFYDFTQERPTVWLDEFGERHISWPENDVRVLRYPGSAHDLVVVSGVEPHTRWRTFAEYLIEIARRCRCEVVVTLGASAEPVPHTRLPLVVASSAHPELAERLGLSRPQYQGPTGVFGVLHEMLVERDIPAISLRVPVPHYLTNAEHPQSTAALLRHLEHVVSVPTAHTGLAEDIQRWRRLHDAAVAADRDARSFLAMLERDFDRRMEASLPTGDDLADEFERFLRDHGNPPDA
jgi:hypothetical protein